MRAVVDLRTATGRLPDHADLDQPVKIWIDLLSAVVDETVLVTEAARPQVVLGSQLSRSPTEGLVEEGLSDTSSIAEGQDVQRDELLIAHGRMPLVLGRWAECDEPHNLIPVPGDADLLPRLLRREPARPHLSPGLAGGVVVETPRKAGGRHVVCDRTAPVAVCGAHRRSLGHLRPARVECACRRDPCGPVHSARSWQ